MSNPVVILNLPRVVDTAGTHHTVVAAANRDSFSTTTTFSEISDEEEKDACSVNCVDNGKNQEPTINVVNSSDVVIGSVTQFHGPVTIVQHLPPQQSIEDKHCEANLVTTDYTASSSKLPPATCLPKRLLVCFATVTVLTALIALSIVLSIDMHYNENDTILDEDAYGSNGSLKHNLSGHHFYLVEGWGGRTPVWETPVTRPIAYVIVSHTVTAPCQSFSECALTMRNIQGFHITQGEPNVGYNFIIGGDGSIYEGRGWYTKNYHRDSSIGVSFVGNYIYDELTDLMIDAFDKLLIRGVLDGILPPTFKLVAHNQTIPTLSPGPNVYKVIKTYSNYYAGLLPTIRKLNHT